MGILDGLRSIDEMNLENRKVFLRLDLDVPIHSGKVSNDERIRSALPTIELVVRAGARVVVAGRLAAPKGREASEVSLEPVAERLSELVKGEVYLPDDCIGDAARKVVQDLRPGQLCVLENLGRHPEELENDEAFALELARFADVYVSDSLRDCPHAHASVVALPRLLRDRGIGLRLRDELKAMARVLETPERPLLLMLGGPHAADELELLQSASSTLLAPGDAVLIAGTLGNTLLAARGLNLQSTHLDSTLLARGRALMTAARNQRVELVLPTDLVVAESSQTEQGLTVAATAVPEGAVALDVGPKTLELFAKHARSAKIILWSGALGLSRKPAFAGGTLEFARLLAESSAFSLVIGEDTALALGRAEGELLTKMGFVSTGGRASLELLEGRRLPGVEALRGGGT